VARRGARNLESNPPVANTRKGGDDQDRGRPPSWEDSWQDEGPVRGEAARAVARGAAPPRPRRAPKEVPSAVRDEVARAAGPDRADRSTTRLQDAAGAYSRERFQDARRIIADCHRALGQFAEVERRWDELRRAGAGVEVLTEARIVLAGAMADRGDVVGGIRTLLEGPVDVRKPQEHNLRLWYALAGLYERAGDVPRARELFARLAHFDPTFADVTDRLDALS
jgi:hypothetical protein